ncbi:DUF6461 domain-containing protein [Nonomuraea sp. NPDC002799]
MSDATAATYEWLYREYTDGMDETWLCACFVREVSPREALRRLGVTPGPITGAYGFGIAAWAARGGAVLVETGWGGVAFENACGLSEGSATAAVFVTSEGADFTYCVDGRLITAFDLYEGRSRTGEDPGRLQADLRELGMETGVEDPGWAGVPTAAALALAERATGVHLSQARYASPALAGPTEHLAPYI